MLISLRLPVSYRGLAPHKITPVPGVHKTLNPTAEFGSVLMVS
jgi:hypothetical protein